MMLTEAIAETTLLFFVLLTFYFIFKNSKWAYLFACLASVTRYEGAALILAVFINAVLEHKDKKQILKAIGYSALACIPLGIWVLSTFLYWEGEGSTHYLNVFSKKFVNTGEGQIDIFKHVNILWNVGFYPLSLIFESRNPAITNVFLFLSKSILWLGFIFAIIYGSVKRNRKILFLLIFFVPYFVIHALYPFTIPRFYSIVFWIPLLISLYGLVNLWQLATQKVPDWVIIFAEVIIAVIAFSLVIKIGCYLPGFARFSRDSSSIAYVSMALIIMIFIAKRIVFNFNQCWRDIVLSLVVILFIFANQPVLAQRIGNGERDIEFKYLLDWYSQNAQAGEKIALTVPIILQTMGPEYKDNFVHIKNIEADDPLEFVKACYKNNITYVAWDSRIGYAPNDPYYKLWKVKNIAPLSGGKSVGPYDFLAKVGRGRRFVYVYKLKGSNENNKINKSD